MMVLCEWTHGVSHGDTHCYNVGVMKSYEAIVASQGSGCQLPTFSSLQDFCACIVDVRNLDGESITFDATRPARKKFNGTSKLYLSGIMTALRASADQRFQEMSIQLEKTVLRVLIEWDSASDAQLPDKAMAVGRSILCVRQALMTSQAFGDVKSFC